MGVGHFCWPEVWVYQYQFSSDIEIEVKKENERIKINYHTPAGPVSTTILYSEEMRKGGVSAFWIKEHSIKTVKDYEPIGYIFERLKLLPGSRDFVKWQEEIGQEGWLLLWVGELHLRSITFKNIFSMIRHFTITIWIIKKRCRRLAERMGIASIKLLNWFRSRRRKWCIGVPISMT